MRKSILFLFCSAITALIIFGCNNNNSSQEQTAARNSKEDSITSVVARGNYIVNHVAVCVVCHSDRDASKFALPVTAGTEGSGATFAFGPEMGIPGEITPPNITSFKLKEWTDEEIIRAITHGVNKKGDTLFPVMPYHNYSRLAKDDIQAIVAYVRTLPAIDKPDVPKKLMITPSQYPPLPPNTLDQNTRPDPSDRVKYGEYLVTMASCNDCHTPMTPQGAPDFSKMLAGGWHIKTTHVDVTVANITPDSTTGIGAWSEETFLAKFRTNLAAVEKGDNPGKMNTEMPWGNYARMKEDDLKAIYAYLRTVPPVKNKVEKWPASAMAK